MDESMPLGRRAFVLGGAACAFCAAVGYVRSTAGATGVLQLAAGGAGPPEATTTSMPPSVTRAQRAMAQPDAVFDVRTDRPLVGLSFDDGPDPMYTPYVLEQLARFDARATFFAVGANAVAHPDLIERHVRGGHDIGNHTQNHPQLQQLPPLLVAAEINAAEHSIVAAGAPVPRLFRPPRGYTDRIIGAFADSQRYRTVFWDVCVERFVYRSGVRKGVGRLLRELRPGAIVLAHDGGHIAGAGHPVLDRSRTMEALPLLLEGIRSAGLEPVDVATLLRARRQPPKGAR